MGKPIGIGQSHAAISALTANTQWDALDCDILQRVIDDPCEAGKHFTVFLKNGGRVIVGEPKIIPIDRSKRFNPAKFIDEGWKIEEEDERSLALTEIDLTAVRFESMLKDGENRVQGEEKLARLKTAGHIRLDARIFQTLWENQHLIPARWKEQTNGNTTYLFFDGTILRSPRGFRCVRCLYWSGGQWHWLYSWLGNDWGVNSPSAVLAS